MAHGFEKALGETGKENRSGAGRFYILTQRNDGSANMVYNRSTGTVIIADNSITGMTGHQHNPSSGYDIHGNSAPQVDFESFAGLWA